MIESLRVERVERLSLALSAGAVAASAPLVSPGFAASVAAGALLEAVNFRGLFRAGRSLFAGRGRGWGALREAVNFRGLFRAGRSLFAGRGRGWGAGWTLRFGFLALGIGASLYFGAHPVGLVIGLSMIMPAAVIEAWRTRPPVDPQAPSLPPDDPSWDRWDPWLARERDVDDDEEETG